jgi:hypothetical protein
MRYFISNPMSYPSPLRRLFFVLSASFAVTLSAATLPLDFSRAANMGLRDEVPGDRRGGWTDQGRANDLADLKPGVFERDGLTFTILDPARNNNRACIVLAGPNRGYLPRSAAVTVSSAAGFGYLYLLHGTAWTPGGAPVAGVIVVRYADGAEQRIEAKVGRDVADWWGPSRLPNGSPVWTREGVDGTLGLYASKFAIQNKPVREVRFESSGAVVWGVVAATLSDQDIAFSKENRVTYQAGREWASLPAVSLDVRKDGVFDFSRLIDAPAGKYGAIRATPAGHLEFEGRAGERVRFWGVNLTFGALFPDKEAADLLAERLARSGYNTVRLHHYDRDLLRRGGKNSYDFDPEKLDRLNYLFAAFKKRGLYISMDLYTVRSFGADEIPEWGKPVQYAFKGLVPIYDSAFMAWKNFAERLLTRKNPYTGLTWAEDPALVGICPINEDTLTKIVKSYGLEELYATEFEKWIARPENAAETNLERPVAYNRFLIDTQRRSDGRMHAYLRSIGTKALLTGANWMTFEETNYLRDHYDYADLHNYWDHPQWAPGWGLPAKYNQASAVARFASHPRSLMPTRIFGKPFVVTETNYCWPNSRRAEGTGLLAAYAGLQDWDGIYTFNYSDVTGDTSYRATAFELASDPLRLVADRVGALIFRQGQVTPAKAAVAIAVHEETAFTGNKDFRWPFNMLGLVTRVGSFNGDTGLPDSLSAVAGLKAVVSEMPEKLSEKTTLPVLPANTAMVDQLKDSGVIATDSINAKLTRFVSETGQARLRSDEGVFTLVTDRTEVLVAPAGIAVAGRLAALTDSSTYASVYVAAVDGKPLEASKRILVLFLTDCLNTGTRLSGENLEVLEDFGRLPYLVRRGTAQLSLGLPNASGWRAWPVDTTGMRLPELKLNTVAGRLVLPIDNTAAPAGPVFAYELARD